jgi:uroporphyrinogen-III synthase
MPFDGLRVLSLESRRAHEIEVLIRKQGGEAFVAPSVRERALEDQTDVFRLLQELEAGRFEMLVLMTGVGLGFWHDAAVTRYPEERVKAALRNVKLLARGPKPSSLLRSWGLAPDVTIPEPNTWREVVEALKNRPEKKVAVQEYGRPNAEFVQALRQMGIQAETFALYRWELPEDTRPLQEAVHKLAAGEVDVAMFTSSVQLEHLLMVAAEAGVKDKVLDALRTQTVVASIGPVMSATLEEHAITPDIAPLSPKMGALVKAAGDEAAAAMSAKRNVRM